MDIDNFFDESDYDDENKQEPNDPYHELSEDDFGLGDDDFENW